MATQQQSIHVVGGGLAGLTAAAFAARAGHRVVVHEQRGRLGGRATTDDRGGYRFNQGPHALYVGGEAMAILGALDIHPGGNAPPSRGARMVFRGTSHRAPGGIASLAMTRLLGARDKAELARLLSRLARFVPSELAGITVDEWLGGHIDRPRPAAVVRAIVRLASYVNAPGSLSAEVAVLQLQRALSSGVIYVDGGWEGIVARLADEVRGAGGTIDMSDPLTELPDAAAVIVATGGPDVVGRLVGHRFDTGPAAEASVLDLALVAPPHDRFVIGVDEPIYLSDHGSPRGMTPVGRASVSLAQYLAPPGEPDAEPDRERLRAFARHAAITSDQIVDERYLHRMTTVTAIATAARGGLAGRPPVDVADRPGVFVAGDWVGSAGHLADAALHSGREAARAAVRHLERSMVV